MSSYNSGGKSKGSHGGPRFFYGVTIHDCIKRGNKEEMHSLLAEAKKHYQEEGDLGAAIQELEKAISKK
jgi:hypothetical protein